MTFEDFNLAAPIARAITEAGYTEPSPIQQQAIPLALEGRDIMGIAQTGTGKTLAFSAPTLDKLNALQGRAPERACRVLVLAPTRELAAQIADSFRTYSQFMGLRIVTAFGGVKIGGQKRALERGAHVLVATPGRLEDLMQQKAVTLDHVHTLILDEADQMLDLGFIHALKRIESAVPKDRQTLFFSATMPKSIADLSQRFLKDPSRIEVAPAATTAERVDQRAYFISQKDKPALLANLLKRDEIKHVLVFTRTKHGADKVVRQIGGHGIEAVAIHGNKSQPQRRKALDAFKSGDVWVMVATEIAARGLDISGLTHVVNYDLPNVPEQYVHRIGRTGRAEASGVAISLVAGDEKGYLRDIEKTIGQKVPVADLPDGFTPDMTDVPPPKQGGGRGRGGGGHGPGRGRAAGGPGRGRGKPGGHRGGQARDGEARNGQGNGGQGGGHRRRARKHQSESV